MIESAREACQYLEGVSREDFREKRPVQHCVIRCIEIVGEAASRVSENLRTAHDEIQWRHIVGMRNWIFHAYFEIELGLV